VYLAFKLERVMKLIGLILVVVTLAVSSCQKYQLNQPAYLSFNWDFFQSTATQNQIIIESGSFYTDGFGITGTRKEGADVAINQSFAAQKITFSKNGSLGLSADIPVGTYEDFAMKVNVVNPTVPCIQLKGLYHKGNEWLPFVIEWHDPNPLVFKPLNSFTLTKKQDYKVSLGIDVDALFSNVSYNQWEQASVTNEDGISTIIIRENYNVSIFDDVTDQLSQALKLIVD
jgi:hypothetical protein